uniref:Uncharacterized protein n=1 Tax=Ophidocladus simpliciusculus TaxID=1261574 RepID=A0A1Z1MIT8_9FLOR|nr:hypothetical protein [Ophidocladus simpliciusculus]ARW65978.1 hypothetical protein [Ophidocladus simpliciusculus]
MPQKELLNFLKCFKGQWFIQNNKYLLQDKFQKIIRKELFIFINQDSLQIYNNKKFNTSQLKFTHCKMNNFFKYKCYKKNRTWNQIIDELQLNFSCINSPVLKVCCNLNKKNLIYEEKIYFVDKNLIIARGLLRNLNSTKYFGTIITSYIKINND